MKKHKPLFSLFKGSKRCHVCVDAGYALIAFLILVVVNIFVPVPWWIIWSPWGIGILYSLCVALAWFIWG